MASCSFPHSSLESLQITSDASANMESRVGGENGVVSSMQSQNWSNPTPDEAQYFQEFVNVVVRLRPPTSDGVGNPVLQYSIESGTLGTPCIGHLQVSHTHENAVSSVNGGEAQLLNRGRFQNDELACTVNDNCSIGSPMSTLTATVTPSQNGLPQAMYTPRVGVANRGKILTVSPPMSGDAKEVQHVYEFGDVIDSSVTDEEMCRSIVPGIIGKMKAGFNACVLCYGQGISGRMHTTNAITLAFITALFDTLDAENDTVELSYVQICNNDAYNLLGEDRSEQGVLLNKTKGTLMREPRYIVRDAADARSKIAEAQQKRFVGSQTLNALSSCSHAFVSFYVTKSAEGIPVLKSSLTLGDLAVSEGVADVELEKKHDINNSLSVIHAVLKAVADDTEELPEGESILIRDIASALVGSYLFLIATVSMDERDYAETRRSLDFATIAKRYVVKKGKKRTIDFLPNLTGSFEDTYMQLIKEVDTLRYRVHSLQEELNAQNQCSALIVKGLSPTTTNAETGTTDTTDEHALRISSVPVGGRPEIINVHEHVLELERQCAVFQRILGNREKELNAFASRGDVTGNVVQELQQLAKKREEAQRGLEEAPPELATCDLRRKVAGTIVWRQEELDSVCQQKKIIAKVMEGMRCEQHRMTADLLETRKRLVRLESAQEESSQKLKAAAEENVELKEQIEELNLRLLREYAERAIREETVAWFKASTERDEQCEQLRTVLEEQRNLCDVLQGRLNSTEHELDRSNKQQGALLQEMRKKDEAFRTIWLLLTPHQKARFLSFGDSCGEGASGAGSSSLHQGHENVQLRSQLRTLKRQLEEVLLRNRELEYRIEDLEKENHHLQGQLQNREDEYKNLVSLDQDYRNEREHMEQQIAHLFTYIEEHNAKEQVTERQLRDAQSEWERLNQGHRNAQREVVDLTAKLEKVEEELRAQRVDNIKAKDRVKESQKQDSAITSLHHQLAVTRHSVDETYRRRAIAGVMRQHVASDVNTYNPHADIIKRKIKRRNPELSFRAFMQSVDPAQFVRVATAQHLPLNGHGHRQRNGMSSQLRRRHSPLVFLNETTRPWNGSFGGGCTHSCAGCRRRKLSQSKANDVKPWSQLMPANAAAAEDPTLDKFRRGNS
ncbi:putative kinesin [Trypanosoma rangeli]|uniref:Putative kinesin n=1 Tax=Trypanosoma rangeli TaxID=5698 RepID=A0A3R7MSM7_TRYRA|nr:putative kinesin [Trypanosoma rangeli]RNF07461.1 putative kinesin [Trypanosoma rangeli]|eukprot:RNF07461.1 putative kinesin [Trypanosoma rangeli]